MVPVKDTSRLRQAGLPSRSLTRPLSGVAQLSHLFHFAFGVCACVSSGRVSALRSEARPVHPEAACER